MLCCEMGRHEVKGSGGTPESIAAMMVEGPVGQGVNGTLVVTPQILYALARTGGEVYVALGKKGRGEDSGPSPSSRDGVSRRGRVRVHER